MPPSRPTTTSSRSSPPSSHSGTPFPPFPPFPPLGRSAGTESETRPALPRSSGWEEKLDRIENLLRLAAAAKDGRPDALGELLTASAGIVHALTRSRLGDTLLAEEAAQAALTRAARGFPKLRNPRTWPAWLKTIALRAAADAARRAVDPMPAEAAATRVDSGPGPVAMAIRSERAVLVRRAVNRLPARLRDPVLLACSEDLAYREIAAVLGTSPATVTRRIAAAHARIRAMLGDEP